MSVQLHQGSISICNIFGTNKAKKAMSSQM